MQIDTTTVVVALAVASSLLVAFTAALMWLKRRRASRRALESRVAELEALSNAVSRIASAAPDEQSLCHLVYECAAELVDVSNFQLGLFDDDDYVICVRSSQGVMQPMSRYNLAEGRGIVGWMRETGKSLLVRDFETEMPALPAQPRYISSHPPRSAVFVPMVSGDQVIGAMAIQSDTRAAYTDSHLRILSIIANQSAAAIRNARALAQERRRAQQLELVNEVARQTAAILDPDTLMPRLTEAIRNTFGYYFVGLCLIDEESGRIVMRAATNPGMLVTQMEVGEGLIGACIKDQAIVISNDAVHDERYLSAGVLPETRSEIVLPLRLNERVIGALDLQSDQVAAFSSSDQRYLEILAQQVSVAIEDARLYEAEREQTWMSTALLQVAEVAGKAETLDDALTAVARLAPLLTGVDCSAVLTYDAAFEMFEITALFGPLSSNERLAVGDVLLVSDVPALEEMLRHNTPVMGKESGRLAVPMLALPLIAQDQLIGALLVGQHDGLPFSKRRVELLAGLANQAALVIDVVNANLAQQEESWVTAALLQVARAVTESADLETIVQTIVRLTPLLVGVEACALFVREGNDTTLRASQAYGLSKSAHERFSRDEFPMAAWREWFLEFQRTQRLPALNPTPDGIAERMEVQHSAALPLIANADLVGAMVIGAPRANLMPEGRSLSILIGIVQQTALAVDNARLSRDAMARQRYEQDLAFAREIQTSFLPKECPRVTGWGVAAAWQAARQVGGDFYDFIALPDGRYGLVIADVADKGVPAALFMALTRTLMRAVAFTGRAPSDALSRVNELILSDSHSDLFVTMFYVVWSPVSGELIYANAGHNLPLLVQANGEVTELYSQGIALGVVEHIAPESGVIQLHPGDIVVLYTDGITDALNHADQEFGLQRLKSIVSDARALSSNEVVARIMSAVRDFAGNEPPFDDQTLVVLKRETR
ncbi:MAG: SpoIIE family protein phosphatase [Chloroflexi bacterium]|nr:SpoIIE family protein phosphatase [Chloroflexota bacterium]MCL5273934.1 SpoIIE family protein phosphatase [Chloroflexota bacterium]